MKRKIIALFLTLCLCVSLVPAVFASGPSLEDCVDVAQVEAYVRRLFLRYEGSYDTVVAKDNNALSIGFVQWHGNHALKLMKMICCSDPVTAEALLGTDLFTEIVNASDTAWKTRVLSSAEVPLIRAAIDSEVGHWCQDTYANEFILEMLQHGWSYGVRTDASLVYYCALENKYGSGDAKAKIKKAKAGLGLSDSDVFPSLDVLHYGIINYTSASASNRQKIYNYIVNTLGLDPGPAPGTTPFIDLPAEGHWAHDAIVWAYNHDPQITAGTSLTTFSPYAELTRGEAVTFLWAAAGKPSPTSTSNPFQDVSSDKYYYRAVLWASENGITAGKTPTSFAPNDSVSRAEMITFLWAFAGKPAPASSANPFPDVSSNKYYFNSVLWAYGAGILVGNEGEGSSNLQPKQPCNRAYVVTYLYHYFTR